MNLEQLLKEELHLCHAPVSGYFVVCAISTNKETYFGHNNEKENPTIFEHAETMAITKMLMHETTPIIQLASTPFFRHSF